MPKQLKIELPSYYNDDEVKEYFRSNVEDLYSAMDLEIGQDEDSRLQIDEIEIEDIELSADCIFINYSIEFSAYYGCDDANFADSDHRTFGGTRVGSTFTFDEHVYPERRSTIDEF